MRGRHKKWARPYLDAHPDLVYEKIDRNDPFFSLDSDLYLEVGTGKGDFILKMPDIRKGHYLGLEKDASIAGMAAKRIVLAERKDVRMAPLDFDEAYEELLGLHFKAIFLNFSDPWPKKRHWKRRLTAPNRLKMMNQLLPIGGEIVFKSDNVPLYLFTLEGAPSAGFSIVSSTLDYPGDPQIDAPTEYESNFRSQGVKITRIILRKISDSQPIIENRSQKDV